MAVYIIGAGPGDPSLNTHMGTALLAAQVIVIDRLARPVLESQTLLYHLLVGETAPEVIDVGKAPGGKGWRQEEINALIVEKAREGKDVVRVKGGDPFVFGRGIEEVRACQEAGIPCTVFPGLSSVVAAPTLAGIPLTLRGVSSSFHVMTGQVGEKTDVPDDRWQRAAGWDGTLVILMGVESLQEIAAKLIVGGRDPDTPAAIIEQASLPGQRVTLTTLEALAERARATGTESPAVVVVGEVVKHRVEAGIRPEGRRPLRGKGIAVTGSWDNEGRLRPHIEALGGTCYATPFFLYGIRTLTSLGFDDLKRRAQSSDHLLFTSVRAVESIVQTLGALGESAESLGPIHCIAVGPRIEARLLALFSQSAVVRTPVPGAKGLETLDLPLEGRRVLWLRGEETRDETRLALERRGVELDEMAVYGSKPLPRGVDKLRSLLRERLLDAVLWVSPRGVETALGDLTPDERRELTGGVLHAAIGETTAEALRHLGLSPVVASEPDLMALLEAATHRLAEDGVKP